jgi:TetR/AcrR family transcriptional repressor of nem operon
MARIREFDTDKAVAQTMDLFWEPGHEGTSLQDLTEGLAIGALYAAFGSKDGLYQAALERYRQERVGPMLEALSIDSDVRGVPRGLLTVLDTDAVADDRRRGCMVVNAARSGCPTTRQRATPSAPCCRATRTPSRRRSSPPASAANSRPTRTRGALGGFLGTFITGLRVAAKTNPDEVALMRTVEVAVSVLD